MKIAETVTIFATIIAGLLVVGCSTTSEFTCRSDWLETGRTDGANGVAGDRIERYTQDCAEFEIVPDQVRYENGRQEGLTVYCTQENGYAVAIEDAVIFGNDPRDACPFNLTAAFRAGFGDGTLMLNSREAVADLTDNKRDLENDIRCTARQIDGDVTQLGGLRIESESNASRQARGDVTRLTANLESLELDLAAAEGRCTELAEQHQELNYRIDVTYCSIPTPAEPPRLASRFEDGCATGG